VVRARHAVTDLIDVLDEQRADIVDAYRLQPGGSVGEHELGEVLTVVRKAVLRARKALLPLLQEELPFDQGAGG